MSIVFTNNKEKRSRSSSSEANSSFVKNVTSRVSGLLPATITKWFSSPNKSSANGSAPTADATDSSTEDEAPESTATWQPPSKRMRFGSPSKCNNYNATDANNTEFQPVEFNTYNTVQLPPSRNTFRREANFISTPLIRPSVEESTIERVDKDTTMFKSQHSVSNIGSSVAPKRKSLFDSPSSADASIRACVKTSCNTIRDPNQPCFKPSLLGSPFYPGRTTYGGASSSYINQPNIKQKKNAYVNESNYADNTISHSARRIMDLLEDYSSPLNEAKRIPQYVRSTITTSPNSSYESPSHSQKALSYKTQELHVPRIASILRLKKRSRLMDTTNAARQIIASHSSTSDYLPNATSSPRDQTENDSSNKFTTKVKPRLTRANRGSIDMETTMPEPVNLPSAVLQIDKDKLPNFSFGLPPVSHAPSTSSTKFTVTETTTRITESKTTTKTMETPVQKPDIISSKNPYTFSSPVRISNESHNATTTPPKFSFGSPERSVDKANISEKKDNASSCVVGMPKEFESKTSAPKSKDWQCSDCWVFNKVDIESCVCCGGKKPSKLSENPSKCSVCKFMDSQLHSDKCVNCDKIKINNISTQFTTPATAPKWKCNDCWVDNVDSADKCICCGGKNPTVATTKQSTIANDTDSEWKCDVCWIKNKNSLDKCAACGGAKSNTTPSNCLTQSIDTSSVFASPARDSFKIILKSQTDKWECSNCLVRNDNDKTKCACCETERPGTTKDQGKQSFNFGVNSSFKFGIDPKESASSQVSLVNPILDNKGKVEESETNNNVLAQAPSFTFGLPSKKAEDHVDSSKKVEEKSESAPKINFTFGIPISTKPALAPAPVPTPASAVLTTAPVFGSPTQLSELTPKANEEKEKLQEVPTVTFTLPKPQESPKTMSNLFTSPVSLQKQSISSSPLMTSSLNLEKKETTNSSVFPVLQPVTSNEDNQQTTFSFSSGSIKRSSRLFSSTAPPTSTTCAPFTSPIQSDPVSATVSHFQNSESAPTTVISILPKTDTANTSGTLFQNNEPTATTAASSLGVSGSLFSFGNNAQPTLPQAEKPKFNFSFGSSTKTETQPLFNPPFGATDSASTNKFTMPAMGSANTLGGNGLSTGNGLPPNPIGGNEMVSNSIPGGNGLHTGNALPIQSGGLFSAPVQKENMWSSNNTPNNPFVTNAPTNSLQKPVTFSFGTSTPFNAPNATPAFGAAQSTPNVFGLANQNTNNQTIFSNPSQNQSAPSLFGGPQTNINPAPSMGVFGTPNIGATPTFGTPNPSIPSFEAPSLTPAQAPAFNFGAPQSTGIFGFGQQQQQAGGIYSFGTPSAAPQVQFNMGSAPNTTVRRVRKAVRRNATPR